MSKAITTQTFVRADRGTVWKCWTDPKHVVHWNAASDDWECPTAKSDLTEGGKFSYTMRAKDKSASFDFNGTYTKIEEGKSIEYVIEDGRKVSVNFEDAEEGVEVTETFDPENENPEEMQQAGWQSILDNFKRYTESLGEIGEKSE